MSEEFEDIVDNIREPSVWIRILFMVAFSLAGYFVLLPLIIVLSIAQALFTLITGQSNANLRYFSATLGLYVTQVINYLTYLSEVRPYPFSDLPEVEDVSLQEESAPDKSKAAQKKSPVKKKAAKKKAAKKKAAKKSPKSAAKADSDSSNEDADNS